MREGARWQLYADAAESPAVTVSLRGDKAWRLFTNQKIDPEARIEGSARYAEPVLRMVSIVR
jgi:hypothetical protein